ncbi:MAG: ribonuclease P protein subunit [Thermoplasmata archaeon]|jgi:ribonuclease P protein subunit POP4
MTWVNIIGKEARIIESSNPNMVGIQGRIIDETKKTIIIMGRKKLVIPKDTVNLMIDGRIFYGRELLGRPVERISRGDRR